MIGVVVQTFGRSSCRRAAVRVVTALAGVFWVGGALGTAGAQDIPWRHDYNRARAEATETGKPLLIDFSTQHCYWCKRLDTTTFRDHAVSSAIASHCVPLKLDGDREQRLTQALNIESYPTLVLASPDGTVIDMVVGYVDARKLTEHLNRAVAVCKARPAADPAAEAAQARSRRAKELLGQARGEYQTQQWLCCLEHCDSLTGAFAGTPEAAEAGQISAAIHTHPEWVRAACDGLSDRLGRLYLAQADVLTRQGQTEQARACLERVLQTAPGSRHAEAASARIMQLKAAVVPAAAAEPRDPQAAVLSVRQE